MSRYWILDREDTPQGFPLGRLLARIREVTGGANGVVQLRRSQGYGEQVCQWDSLLDRADEVTVAAEDLARISEGTDEWFYDLDARFDAPGASIAFGVHDSSALFVDAPATMIDRVTAPFRDVQPASLVVGTPSAQKGKSEGPS